MAITVCSWGIWQNLTHWTQIPVTIVAATPPDRFELRGNSADTKVNAPAHQAADKSTPSEHNNWYGQRSWLRHQHGENGPIVDSLVNGGSDPYSDDLGTDREYQRRYPLGATRSAWAHPQLAKNGLLKKPAQMRGVTQCYSAKERDFLADLLEL